MLMDTFKALTFNFQENKDLLSCLSMGRHNLRPLKSNEVLVKIETSTFNPSDTGLLRMSYQVKANNIIPGNEGVGIVVNAGSDKEAQKLLSKRIASYRGETGFWAEYIILNAASCILVDDDIPIEQATTMCINPPTVLAIIDYTKKCDSSSLVHNAGASQLGQMLIVLAKEEDIKVINMVRRQAQVELLNDLGSDLTINLSEADAYQKLKSAINKFNTKVAFDAIAGDTTGKLIDCLPPAGQVFVYGGLSGNPVSGIGIRDLIYMDKAVKGLLLTNWLNQYGSKKAYEKIQNYIRQESIKTSFMSVSLLEEAPDAMRQHLKEMTKGKVLITPKSSLKASFQNKLGL